MVLPQDVNSLIGAVRSAAQTVAQKSAAAETANDEVDSAMSDLGTNKARATVALRRVCQDLGMPFVNADDFAATREQLQSALREMSQLREQLDTVSHERDDLRASLERVSGQLEIAQNQLATFREAGFEIEEYNPNQPGNDVNQNQGNWFNIFRR